MPHTSSNCRYYYYILVHLSKARKCLHKHISISSFFFFFSFSVLGIPIKLHYLTFNIIEEMIHGLTLLPIFFVLPHLIGLNLIHIHMVRRHNICNLSVTLIFIFVLIFILHINIFNYHCLSFSCNFPSHFLVA